MSSAVDAARSERLHREATVIDGHSDILMAVADGKLRLGERFDLPEPAAWQPPAGWPVDPLLAQWGFSPHALHFQTAGQYDLPRLQAGGVTAQLMATYIEDSHLDRGLHRALEMIAVLRREIEEHDDLELVTSADDLARLKREGKVGAVLAFEGFEPLVGDLGLLPLFYDLGLRVASLTHSRRNVFADGAIAGIRTAGLTTLGRGAVQRMVELGIVIDLVHLAYPGCEEVLTMVDVPVVLSHGGVRGMFRGASSGEAGQPPASDAETRRVVEGIARSGGVIGVIAFDQPSIAAMVDDVVTLVGWAGEDHVGLGSDFFGVERAPADYRSIDELPKVTRALVDRGFADGAILKLLGGNWARVFGRIWH